MNNNLTDLARENWARYDYKTHSISPCGKRLHSVRKKRPQAAVQRNSRKKNRRGRK